MRGKLRDKRTAAKRDIVRREVVERRRPTKRDTRPAVLLYQQVDEDDYELYDDEEEVTEQETPQQK